MAEFAQKRANSAITTLALGAKLCKAHNIICNIFVQGKFYPTYGMVFIIVPFSHYTYGIVFVMYRDVASPRQLKGSNHPVHGYPA